MPAVYCAKVNVNSKIYSMYDDPQMLAELWERMFDKLDQELQVPLPSEKGHIKFITLEKDTNRRFIAGRVVKIFEDDIQVYNSLKDDVQPLPYDKLARSVMFYFDLNSEYVAFVTGRYFGYRQFCSYFKALLDGHSDDIEFEVYLEKNANIFREKIKIIKKILEVEIRLIAPNNSAQAFNKLFLTSSEELKESKATRLQQTLYASAKSDGINIDVPPIQRAIDSISNGYGDMTITGKDPEGQDISLTSDKEAPHKGWIPEGQRYSIPDFIETGRNFIIDLFRQKQSEQR